MTLEEMLLHRRAVRIYDPDKPVDTEIVRHCIEQAQLAPTSSNMQLWECYHVIAPRMLQTLSRACLNQQSARTARQMVVFVIRPDRYKAHAKAVLEFEKENVRRYSPAEKQARRIANMELYYDKLMPAVYRRGGGLIGLGRKMLALLRGLSHPVVRQVSETDMRVKMHKSCALVAQTFMLAMSEAGYDTCPLEGFDSLLVRRALHLPYSAEINMIIPCGVRTEEGVRGERFRLPFSENYQHIC